jgi:UDP-N-acetylmuramoyl-tripeptide--D-alanyl-D-alanine ligase
LCTDSREIRRGDAFVALRGEQFDGHQFVESALRRGAAGALVDDASHAWERLGKTKGGRRCILAVPDTLVAYQQLARHHRDRFRIPVVAVTGSNGKTTTKDMVAAVLAERGTVLKTEGNYNNRIGVAHTVLRLAKRHRVAVVEMGVDQKGQTTRLCEIARPTHGIITNIGPDHLEFFGSMDASAESKAELLAMLPADGAVALNADDAYFAYLRAQARCRVVSFGLSADAEVRAEGIEDVSRSDAAFRLVTPGQRTRPRTRIRVRGAHNLSNALAAAAIGRMLAVPAAKIARGLGRFKPASMRSQVRAHAGVTILNDCYNANPASMKAAIDLLVQLGAGTRTIAVLGDMLELGPTARDLHREVGAYAAGRGIAVLLACGDLGRTIAEGAREAGMAADRVRTVTDAGQAAAAAVAIVRRGDAVLIKASRGMRLERVVEALSKKRGTRNAER